MRAVAARGAGGWLIAALALAAPAAAAAAPPRVISINLCLDQLLIDLAPAEAILGLSPFAADAARSVHAEAAKRFPILSGTAEEVMVLKPDLVLAGTFTKRATREFIRARGVRLEEFPPPRSIGETKAQIARVGALVDAEAKAAARNGELDQALAELRAAALGRPLRVLPLSRRGWVAGSQTLIADVMAAAGLVNAAGELGLRTGGRVSLEEIVRLKPDAILVSRDDGAAEDQGQALLLHPAIAALFPPERRIVIPERLTVCGGPMLADAMRALREQIGRLSPRDAPPR